MRIFVSYARVDKPYCIQIVNTLDVHEVWYDQRLYAGQQWWKEILRRIDWCEGFVYLLSPESVASQYCQRELEIALSHGRQIIPVVIHSETQIPDALAETQYVNLTTGLNGDSVRSLLNSIYIAEQNIIEGEFIPITTSSETVNKPRASDAKQMITMAAVAMEEQRYDQAVFLIKQARTNGFKSRFISLDAMLQEAEVALEHQMLQRDAEREYRQILDLIQFSSMRRHACEAFAAFQKVYPDYDPEGIAIECDEYSAMHNTRRSSRTSEREATRHQDANEASLNAVSVIKPPELNLMEFELIPAGVVNINHTSPDASPASDRTLNVAAFEISRYPITNQQYSEFVNNPHGYRNPDWWAYSDA
ncbi:MAG: TIR domain-containing protein, partial [Chloroflexota bacterium]